ncbi:MAG TPA: flavin reductase family protein [Bacilli bacterium]|nr:flavin reductase family protein [Bacteroidales bacterium]HHU18660.1 flavin reductase family protein [Bacilli bacterium]
MLAFDPNEISERQNYKFLIGTIIPRPIAFVTSTGTDEIINGAPFSYFNVVSSNPPMISIAVQRKAGQMKDTARNIIKNKEFVVHIVDQTNVEQINETAANLAPTESELIRAKLTTVPSEKISVPGVKEAKVRFECVLEKAVELGEAGNVGVDLLIGKIVHYHIDETIYQEDQRIDPDQLAAVSRLAGNNYAKIGEIFEIVRPD